MSTRLYVEKYEVDTFGDIDVDFTYSIADISDIERRNTSYSKTLSLPSTVRNQKIFGNIFDISIQNNYDVAEPNVLSNFNPSKQAKAQIFLDNVKIFDGVLRLIKIQNKNGELTYETNVFGRLKDILHTLGDKTLADLNFDDYNHSWNLTEVQNSWARDSWVLGAQNYVYPLVDYGYSADGITYPFVSFKPAVFVREILGRIFAESGFKIVAPFFDTQYFKKLIFITAEKSITNSITQLLNQTAEFVEVLTTQEEYDYPVQFTDVLHEGFTITEAGAKFTWNRSQTINTSLRLIAHFKFISLQTGNTYWRISVKKNGAEVLYKEVFINATSIGQIYFWDIDLSQVFDLVLNDYFEVLFHGEGIGVAPDIQTIAECLDMTFTIGNSVPVSLDLQELDTMKIKYTLPKSMKQRDFLKSIITMHNLYIVQDKLQDNVLEIIPYSLFYRPTKDTAVDWSDKLDYSQTISITPISELTAKEYRLKFSDDADYWGTFYKTKYNEGYGESRTILDNDFELDTKTVEVVFGAPVMREEVQGRITLALYKVENGVKVKDNFKPRITYWKPNTACPSWSITGMFGTANYTAYPYAGHLDNPTIPEADVLFGTPKEVYFSIVEYPSANLYNAFYEPMILAIGNKDSRLLEGQIYLTGQDIMDLDFRNAVKIGNHFYQLQKVDKYNPIGNSLCTVSLFKILSGMQSTEYEFLLLETDFFMLQENGISKFYI